MYAPRETEKHSNPLQDFLFDSFYFFTRSKPWAPFLWCELDPKGLLPTSTPFLIPKIMNDPRRLTTLGTSARAEGAGGWAASWCFCPVPALPHDKPFSQGFAKLSLAHLDGQYILSSGMSQDRSWHLTQDHLGWEKMSHHNPPSPILPCELWA